MALVPDTSDWTWVLERPATTKAYVERRTNEGKTRREIRRCLKRFIARSIYRSLTNLIT